MRSLGAVLHPVTKTTAEGAPFDSSDFFHSDLVLAGERRQNGGHSLLGFDEKVLEIEENRFITILVDKRRSNTCLTAAACTTNPVGVISVLELSQIVGKNLLPVDIVFDFLGHVVVDYVLDIWKVETLRCYISGYQDIFLSFAE